MNGEEPTAPNRFETIAGMVLIFEISAILAFVAVTARGFAGGRTMASPIPMYTGWAAFIAWSAETIGMIGILARWRWWVVALCAVITLVAWCLTIYLIGRP
jgi:hypothetical protein